MQKKVYRSKDDKVFAGIFGGLGHYFDVDATLLRLLWVVITIFSGVLPGVVIYFISIFLIPRELEVRTIEPTVIEMGGEGKK